MPFVALRRRPVAEWASCGSRRKTRAMQTLAQGEECILTLSDSVQALSRRHRSKPSPCNVSVCIERATRSRARAVERRLLACDARFARWRVVVIIFLGLVSLDERRL